MAEVVLFGIIIVPVILVTLLRVNANFVFLSTCLGFLLSNFIATNSLIQSTYSKNLHITGNSNSNIQIALILIPVIVTSFFMFKTVTKPKLIINLIPGFASGILLAILLVPLLPQPLEGNIMSTQVWIQIKNFQDLLIGGSAIYVLVNLILMRPKHKASHHRGKKH